MLYDDVVGFTTYGTDGFVYKLGVDDDGDIDIRYKEEATPEEVSWLCSIHEPVNNAGYKRED